MKKLNPYVESLPAYDKTPKSVFAALAYSLAMCLEGDNFESARRRLWFEWGNLYGANLIPQKPVGEDVWEGL